MVDLNDLDKLKKTQRLALPVHVHSWATYQKIPTGTRQATVLSLYERYHMEEKWFVQHMLKSKTGLSDPERLEHERIIRHYGNHPNTFEFHYEVGCGERGSVDFKLESLDKNLPFKALIEVKNIASWKQSMVILLYKKYHPDCELIAAFFGKRPTQMRQNVVRVALNEWGIHCYWVEEDGRLEQFDGNDVPDEF